MTVVLDPRPAQALLAISKRLTIDELLTYRPVSAALHDEGVGDIPECDLLLLTLCHGIANELASIRSQKLDMSEATRIEGLALRRISIISPPAATYAVQAWAAALGKVIAKQAKPITQSQPKRTSPSQPKPISPSHANPPPQTPTKKKHLAVKGLAFVSLLLVTGMWLAWSNQAEPPCVAPASETPSGSLADRTANLAPPPSAAASSGSQDATAPQLPVPRTFAAQPLQSRRVLAAISNEGHLTQNMLQSQKKTLRYHSPNQISRFTAFRFDAARAPHLSESWRPWFTQELAPVGFSLMPQGDIAITTAQYRISYDAPTGKFRRIPLTTTAQWPGKNHYAAIGEGLGLLIERSEQCLQLVYYIPYDDLRIVACVSGWSDRAFGFRFGRAVFVFDAESLDQGRWYRHLNRHDRDEFIHEQQLAKLADHRQLLWHFFDATRVTTVLEETPRQLGLRDLPDHLDFARLHRNERGLF